MIFPKHFLPVRYETAEHGGWQIVNRNGVFICWCDNPEFADMVCNAINKDVH